MHKIIFYPLGNADTCRIDLSNGKKVLFDYANVKDKNDRYDLRIDLEKALKDDLTEAKKDCFDVVGFTHAHDDHIKGFSEFFHLEHAEKYQGDGRIKISELWVPAAIIMEEGPEDEARILRSEARHRLREGKGIRVFSRPDRLKQWLESHDIKFEDRKSLITDAGQIVPGFSRDNDGVEFFVHSPFAAHVDDRLEDKNESSLVMHATFDIDGQETKFLIIGDSTSDVLSDIVNITRFHKREERLKWDIYDIPHHCSYLALNTEKGTDKTEPVPEVKWLLEQGCNKGILVASSKPIPTNDEDKQPPHRQAANYYKDVASSISGTFKVTMEHPDKNKPKPLEITIDKWGATLKLITYTGGAAAVITQAPRAGHL
ncbi:MAG: hypothetical protein M0T74_03135 [Desulfitobacterium hafniense]|nr:hypothetical protein [Desulfitobacterium hafniense]